MKPVIIYGSLPVVTSLPIHIAYREGIFEKYGLRLEVVNFKSALEKNRAFLRGEVNSMESDTVTTIILASSGFRIKALTHYLVEFNLVSSPGKALSAIKTIAVSMKTVTEWSAHDLLERELRIDPSLFTFIDIQSIPARMESLLNNTVDAAVLPEPWASIALRRGSKLVAKKFTECCMDVFREEVLTREIAERFLASIKDALRSLRENPDKYLDVLAEETLLPPESLNKNLLRLLLREDYMRLSFPRDLFDYIASWTLKRGYIASLPRYEEVFYKL